MSECTHGFCPRCNSFQPLVWTPVTIAEVSGTEIGEFKGLEMKCRNCDFDITKIGAVNHREMMR